MSRERTGGLRIESCLSFFHVLCVFSLPGVACGDCYGPDFIRRDRCAVLFSYQSKCFENRFPFPVKTHNVPSEDRLCGLD